MTEQASPGAEASSDLHCAAITRAGQPCRNRPVEGQRYCRMHLALAAQPRHEPWPAPEAALPPDQDVEELVIEQADEELPIGGVSPAQTTAEQVQELEIEIRDQGGSQPEARDLAADILRLIRENLPRMAPESLQRVARLLRENVSSDYLDPDFWRGVGMVLQYQAQEVADLLRRRMRGEISTDAYGMDAELVELVRPFSSFLYRSWWRVRVAGLDHVPGEGAALLAANHSGVLPWDGMIIATALLEDHPAPRLARVLYSPAALALPGLPRALETFGQVRDTPENALQLLGDGQLVCVFPEGMGGLGKRFADRYQLARFRRSGSVGLAIQAAAPIVPVAVVGAEEIYPMLADAQPLAQMLRLPYFPLTPLFPWLGPLGLVPLPTRWSIAFGEPIATAEYGADAAGDPQLVARLGQQLRERIQSLLGELLAERQSIFG